MIYSVVVLRRGDPVWIDDAILPGLIPDRVLDMMVDREVDALGLCRGCPVACHCHVIHWIERNRGRKLCPVLFHDAAKPSSWTVGELA